MLQGSSFMVGDPFWAFAGLALVVAGGVLAAAERSGAGARDPPLPGGLVAAGGDLGVEADERQAEQARVRGDALDDLRVVHAQVAEAGFLVRAALGVDEGRRAEPLDEPP